MRIFLTVIIITLFLCINVIPPTANCYDQTVNCLHIERNVNEEKSFPYLVINRYDNLPDLTIELNI